MLKGLLIQAVNGKKSWMKYMSLVTDKRLYKWLCPPVRCSVGPCWASKVFICTFPPLPTRPRLALAVYLALFVRKLAQVFSKDLLIIHRESWELKDKSRTSQGHVKDKSRTTFGQFRLIKDYIPVLWSQLRRWKGGIQWAFRWIVSKDFVKISIMLNVDMQVALTGLLQ